MASIGATCWFDGRVLLAIGALSLSVSQVAHADDIRCKNRLVSTGASKYDVEALCGVPDATEHRTEKRLVRRQVTGRCAAAPGLLCTSVVEDAVDVPIDEWTYDFGTQRFLQYLTFEDGKLLLVRSGGYGHKSP